MVKLVIGIGLPGSGKTTALKPFSKMNRYVYISPDEIRERLSGDASNQSQMREVWEEVRQGTAATLRAGENVVVDATFAKAWERQEFIEFARKSGAEWVQGVFANTSFEIASDRNSKRERTVPKHAMKRIYNLIADNPPVVEDGFDSVFELNEFQQLIKSEILMDKGVWVKIWEPKRLF